MSSRSDTSPTGMCSARLAVLSLSVLTWRAVVCRAPGTRKRRGWCCPRALCTSCSGSLPRRAGGRALALLTCAGCAAVPAVLPAGTRPVPRLLHACLSSWTRRFRSRGCLSAAPVSLGRCRCAWTQCRPATSSTPAPSTTLPHQAQRCRHKPAEPSSRVSRRRTKSWSRRTATWQQCSITLCTASMAWCVRARVPRCACVERRC